MGILSTLITQKTCSLVIYYTANGALSLAFGVVYVWAAELFPTNIRARAMSVQSVFARFGAIVSPFVIDIGRTNYTLAIFMFAVPCLITGLLDLAIPETRGTKLPDTIDDLDNDESDDEETGSEETG